MIYGTTEKWDMRMHIPFFCLVPTVPRYATIAVRIGEAGRRAKGLMVCSFIFRVVLHAYGTQHVMSTGNGGKHTTKRIET